MISPSSIKMEILAVSGIYFDGLENYLDLLTMNRHYESELLERDSKLTKNVVGVFSCATKCFELVPLIALYTSIK